MGRMRLTWRPDAGPVPDAGDVLVTLPSERMHRIESIRPVTRGPNVGHGYVLLVTPITEDGVPDGAVLHEVVKSSGSR